MFQMHERVVRDSGFCAVQRIAFVRYVRSSGKRVHHMVIYWHNVFGVQADVIESVHVIYSVQRAIGKEKYGSP